ncbi:MAG: aspartate carbamoyltransferase catalytic subunit, partial [Bacilli bacterium]
MKHVVSMEQLTTSEILGLLEDARRFKRGDAFKFQTEGYVTNLFFENSTRTQCSFQMAQARLGLKEIRLDVSTSSVQKGETLYDTVRTLESIGVDSVVIRHTENNYFNELMGRTSVGIANAGDGSGNHPSQCLLDLLTIQEEFERFEGLKIAIVGDLEHSRVARSNIQALQALGAQVYVSGPKEWYFKEGANVPYINFEEAVKEMDVIMLLRIQLERHHSKQDAILNAYHQSYGLTEEREQQMKPGAIIMHPGPFNRGVESADSVVECDRSRIFKQVENGVFA